MLILFFNKATKNMSKPLHHKLCIVDTNFLTFGIDFYNYIFMYSCITLAENTNPMTLRNLILSVQK